MSSVDDELATLYYDLVYAALPAATQSYLEDLMSSGVHDYHSAVVRKFIGQGRAEGRVEGQAASVLRVLAARGLAVDDDARARIAGCTDLEQLDEWLIRAVTVGSVEHLFP